MRNLEGVTLGTFDISISVLVPILTKNSLTFSSMSFRLSKILPLTFNCAILGTVGFLMLIIHLISCHVFFYVIGTILKIISKIGFF